MAEYQFEPVYVESQEPFSLTYENTSGMPVNWLVGSSFDGTEDTPASALPGSGDDVVLNGYDFMGGGGPYGTATDGVMDSGDLTVIGDASSIAVSMAGQSFKLANGSGGLAPISLALFQGARLLEGAQLSWSGICRNSSVTRMTNMHPARIS